MTLAPISAGLTGSCLTSRFVVLTLLWLSRAAMCARSYPGSPQVFHSYSDNNNTGYPTMLRGINTMCNFMVAKNVYFLGFPSQLCQPLGSKDFCIRKYFLHQ